MQFFCFLVGQQEIGINIDYVLETNSLETFTILPNAEKYIIGLINLRGNIVPVISLLKFLQVPGQDFLNKVVYLSSDSLICGLTITKLSKTINAEESDIKPYPTSVNENIREFFSGIIHFGGRTVQILDINKLFTAIKNKGSK